jgi:myo-inositol-1-phosphate synthase
MFPEKIQIAPPEGKLAVLLPGLGAVATTFIAGVEVVKRGGGLPIGSLTQMGIIRVGKRIEKQYSKIKEFVPLAEPDQLVFGGWDIFDENCYETAVRAQVLDPTHLGLVREALAQIHPMRACFDQSWVRNLSGPNVKSGTRWDQAQALREDIRDFLRRNSCQRAVMVWCGSTEVYSQPKPVHATLEAFEQGLRANDPAIAPSQVYAYAALQEGIPYANGAPNLSADIPALTELAVQKRVPICGKDFKTGQTLMKTILAPGLRARLLGLRGWFSTNILGNRDGEVLDDPGSFKTKEESKMSVLDQILQPELHPELYSKYYHKVRIDYYPPRGDNKEGWDNIDIIGWLGYPMQIKINFLCRDSILAAPLVLDLVLFLDLAQRSGLYGIQEWLSFYFKSPMHAPTVEPEHDLFVQLVKLQNTLRFLRGSEQITYLGIEYYYEGMPEVR